MGIEALESVWHSSTVPQINSGRDTSANSDHIASAACNRASHAMDSSLTVMGGTGASTTLIDILKSLQLQLGRSIGGFSHPARFPDLRHRSSSLNITTRE
jgi:hypothetical protein